MKDSRAAHSGGAEPPNSPGTARQLAFVVLSDFTQTGEFAGRLLDSRPNAIPEADRGLAREIVYGVIRRKLTLDALIEPNVRRPRARIEPELWTILQIGTYQLACLSIPTHAAVHETVELARWLKQPRWTGFLNGVLRAVDRSLTNVVSEKPARDSFPAGTGKFRKCQSELFPDPSADPIGYVSRAYSFPRWLSERWTTRFPVDELFRVCQWFNTPLLLSLRCNSLKVDRQTVLSSLADAGIAATAGEHPLAVRLESMTSAAQLPGFSDGWFTVQDQSAMWAVSLLEPQPGSRVLDLCAAPGTKTTHLAELMQNSGSIIAADVDPRRLATVQDSARRVGADIVECVPIGRDGSAIPDGPFDAILVDVPCSNTGVCGKRPEVRWRISERDIRELAQIQTRLLNTACDRLSPGGRVVYSTCSIEPEENTGVVQAVTAAHPEMELVEEHFHVPGRPADGAYQALLRPTKKPADNCPPALL